MTPPEATTPVTEPTLSVAALKTAVGAVVSPVMVWFVVAALTLPATSVSLALKV